MICKVILNDSVADKELIKTEIYEITETECEVVFVDGF